MNRTTWGAVRSVDGDVVELERLVVRLRLARESAEAGRAALARYALVWWEGTAADRYRDLVDERRARLAALAEKLGWLEDAVTALAAAARAESGPLRAVPEAS